MDPFKAQNFRVVTRLAEGSHAGAALEAKGPERLLEGEDVGDAVRGCSLRVGVCSEVFQFLWCEFLSRAHTVPPSVDFIIPQMRPFDPMGQMSVHQTRPWVKFLCPLYGVQFIRRMGHDMGQPKIQKNWHHFFTTAQKKSS